jgi:hypothetical protein
MRRLAFVSGVVLCSLTSSSVLIGQSTPPLTPFRGLMDHVSQNTWGMAGGTSDGGALVLFMVNGFVLGQGTVSQTGSVTATVSLAAASLPHGIHRVEAVYLGDTTYRASKALISLAVN